MVDVVPNDRKVLEQDSNLLGQVGDRILAAVTPLGVVERGPFAHRQIQDLLLHGGMVVELVLQLSLAILHLLLCGISLFNLGL